MNLENNAKHIITKSPLVYGYLKHTTINCPTLCTWSGPWLLLEDHLTTCIEAVVECRCHFGYKDYMKYMIKHEEGNIKLKK